MTQTAYEIKYTARLKQAMSALRIYDDMGMYAVVPSTSAANVKPYIVDINEHTLYSTGCSCKAGKRNMDCIHRLAVDRVLDEPRTSPKVTAVVEEAVVEEAVSVGEAITQAVETVVAHIKSSAVAGDKTYAQAVQERAEEVGYVGDPRIETPHTHGYGCCGHIVKPEHDGQLCGACACK